MNRKVASILILVAAYVVSAGISYAVFSQGGLVVKKATPIAIPVIKNKNGQVTFDSKLPKTEACPINGVMYSKPQKDWWSQHRPLGIMIENHQDARPQSGISSADAVYEAVAEGGITRFLVLFYCQDGGQVGPVRSARTYFVDFISEYGNNPLYAHVGGANTDGPADALGQITDYGWTGYNDLNQFSIGFPTFWRDYDRLGRTVATEHTMYSTTSKLWDFSAKNRKLTNVDEDGKAWDTTFVPYGFKDDAAGSERPASQNVHLGFWNGYKDYFVDWTYDKATNTYLRKNAGVPHLDKDNGKNLSAKNVVVLSMIEENANDGYENNLHLLYDNKGTGKATIFMDGKRINGTWKKAIRTARTQLFDSAGNPVKLNRGLIWFTVLPTDGVITVK